MVSLLGGVILFFGLHFLPEIGSARQSVVARYGEKSYMAGYAVLSTVGLILFVRGLQVIPATQLWQPVAASWTASLILMWFSVYCLVSMFTPTMVRRVTRHPMLVGVLFWSAAHLISNGDLRALVLFGSFGVLAAYKIPSLNKRKPGAKSGPVAFSRELIAIVVSALVYVAGLYLHPWIAGVPLLN